MLMYSKNIFSCFIAASCFLFQCCLIIGNVFILSNNGAVIRGPEGEVFAAAMDRVEDIHDIETLEAMAMRLGLKLARKYLFQKIDAATDCARLTNLLKER